MAVRSERANLLVVTAAALVATILGAAPASAHGDTGIFTATEATPGSDPLSVDVRARLVYENDNDPAPGATVTVVPIGPAGALSPSPPLRDNGDGTYEGTIALAAEGAWTIRFQATTPDALAETTFGAAASTSAPSTTASPAASQARSTGDDGDDGVAVGLVVAIVVGLVLVLGAVAVIVRRRLRRLSTPPGGP